MKLLLLLFCCAIAFSTTAQTDPYPAKIKSYQDAYVAQHEVVKQADKKYFRFFDANEKYKVTASFTKMQDTRGFTMKTSGTSTQHFYRYGFVNFKLGGQPVNLTIYRSEALMSDTNYKDYLFLPFTDITSGEESYGGGRYLDFRMGEIKNNILTIDFNKAYNPYCAYAKGYNCPIPPRENDIPVAVKAGEKQFAKQAH